jgi:hypothetical protein
MMDKGYTAPSKPVERSILDDYTTKDIRALGVLSELDIAVLEGCITRQNASEVLRISYNAYQKQLAKKVEKVRRIFSE